MNSHAQSREQDARFDDLKRDIRQLREDLSLLSSEIVERKSSQLNRARDEISQESRAAMERMRERGEEVWNRAKHAGDQAIKDVEHRIEERPFMSLLLMFFVGLVLGKIVDRS